MANRILAVLALLVAPLAARAQPRLDSHGFPLPDGAIARLGDLHFVQPGWINCMTMSADGKLIATAGSGIYLWNPDTGKIVRKIPLSGWIVALALSKDARVLAAANGDGDVTLCRTATGEILWKADGKRERCRTEVKGLALVAEDQMIALARLDTEGKAQSELQIQLWDAKTGTLAKTWAVDEAKKKSLTNLGNGHEFVDMSLSPSGNRMVWLASPPRGAKESHNLAFIYNTVTGELLREVKDLRAADDRIDLLDEGEHLFLKSSSFLAGRETRDEKRQVTVWCAGNDVVVNLNDRRAVFTLDYRMASRPLGQKYYVTALGVSPLDKSLFAQDEVGMVRWDLATGKVLDSWKDRCTALAFSANGKRIAMARGWRLFVCDAKLNASTIETEFALAPLIHYLPDGRLVAMNWGGGRFNVWDVTKRKIVESMVRHDAPMIGRSPCSYDSSHRTIAYTEDKGVFVRDLVTNRPMSRLEGVVYASSWDVWPELSGDGKRVLVATRDKDTTLVRWFDTQSGRELGRQSFRNQEIQSIHDRAFKWYAQDGSVFGFRGPDSPLTLVSCAQSDTSRKVQLPVPPLQPEALAMTNRLEWDYESAAFDRFVVASRVRKSQQGTHEFLVLEREIAPAVRRFFLKPLQYDHDGVPVSVGLYWYSRLSPDCRIIGVHEGDSNWSKVSLYETATGRLRGTICVQTGIERFDFSPDGKTLATSCKDTSILVWDLNRSWSGKPELALSSMPADAEKFWQVLGDPDPAAMDPALWALVRSPKHAVPLLRAKLAPVRGPGAAQLEKLIAALDDSDFKKRDSATRALEALPEFAIPALRIALEKKGGALEQRRRMEGLVAKLDEPIAVPSCLRELRALEVLERIGGAEARKIVESLSMGDYDAMLTREARLVLARMPR